MFDSTLLPENIIGSSLLRRVTWSMTAVVLVHAGVHQIVLHDAKGDQVYV